jgi:plastocyanin
MTDTTTEGPESPVEVAGEAAPAEVESPTGVVSPVGEESGTPFWQRPYVERFLVPLVLPLAVVVAVVVYVLNVSRLFLATHGSASVMAGSVITAAILIGAAVLSAAPRLRRSSLVLVTVGFLLVLSSAGWISVGTSEPEAEGPSELGPDVKATQVVQMVAAPGGAFAFAPAELEVKTGLVRFEVDFVAPGHTMDFHEPETLFAELVPQGVQKLVGVAFFGGPGDYAFFCTVPGHEAAGMKGVVHATGDPVSLEQALADAGNPPAAGE